MTDQNAVTPVAPQGTRVRSPYGEHPLPVEYVGVRDGLHTFAIDVNAVHHDMLGSGEATIRFDLMPPRTQVIVRHWPDRGFEPV